jgi:hypothetical protein
VPIGHAAQSSNPVDDCFEYVPSGHGDGISEPSKQNDPVGHLIQLAEKSKTTNSLFESELVSTETIP